MGDVLLGLLGAALFVVAAWLFLRWLFRPALFKEPCAICGQPIALRSDPGGNHYGGAAFGYAMHVDAKRRPVFRGHEPIPRKTIVEPPKIGW